MKTLVLVLLVANAFAADDEIPTAKRGIELLRSQMRDPESMTIEHVYAKSDHKPNHPQICIPFRSKNGFGGYVRHVAEYKGGNSLVPNADETISACAGIERNWDRAVKKGWIDITSAATGNP